MDKIIVNIYVPNSEKKYQMFIPAHVQMYQLVSLIGKSVMDLGDGTFIPDSTAVLCKKDTGSVLNMNLTAKEIGIKNGTNLMLI